MEKSKGTESDEVLAIRDLPRMMVRANFPNGMVTELVEISAATG